MQHMSRIHQPLCNGNTLLLLLMLLLLLLLLGDP
jgi:hypothetical protein